MTTDPRRRADRPRVTLVLRRDGDWGATLDAAFAAATTRGADLFIVDCERPATGIDFVAWETGRQQELDAALAPWQEKHPGVGVLVELTSGSDVDLEQLAAQSQVLFVA